MSAESTLRTSRVPQPPQHAASSGRNLGSGFESLLAMISDPAMSKQYERLAAQVSTIVAAHKQGFSAQATADGVPQVLAFMTRCIRECPDATTALHEPLVAMLEVCGLPIVCTTLNDQRLHVDALKSTMSAICTAVDVSVPVLRITALNVLRRLFSLIRAQCYDDLNRNPNVTFHKKRDLQLAITSDVVATLLRAWCSIVESDARCLVQHTLTSRNGGSIRHDEAEDDDDDDAVCAQSQVSPGATEMAAVCKALLELSNYLNLCEAMITGNVGKLIFSTLGLCDPGDRRIPLCIEMLWNLLTLCPHEAESLGTRDHLQSLATVLTGSLRLGFKLQERELRNDVLVVMGLVAQHKSTLPNFDAALIQLLLDLSCGAEMGCQNAAINKNYHYGTQNEELQMKLLGWDTLVKLCRDSSSAQQIFEWGFLGVLMNYVDVNCEVNAVVAWSTQQLLDIQAHVLRVLRDLMSRGAAYFSSSNGAAIVRSYIDDCPRVSLRNQAVDVLACAATTRIRGELISVGCIPLAVHLVMETTNLELRISCLHLLADLVQRDADLQAEFIACGGIDAVLPLLSLVPEEYTDKLEAVLFATVDCVWQCVFGAARNEEQFVRSGGIQALLAVLESAPAWMLPLPLSCLADLLQNTEASAQCRAWRSPSTGKSGVQIVLELWRMDMLDDRPAAEAVADNHSIGLSCVSPAAKKRGFNCAETTTETGPGDDELNVRDLRSGIVDAPDDIRDMISAQDINFKVYAVMAVVGFEGHSELDANERATLAAVESFVALCKDEVWEAVSEELAAEGITPIAPDAEALSRLRATATERSTKLLATRRAYLDIHKRRKEESEQTFYESLIKKTEEKTVSSHKPMGLTITEAKIRKAQMLKASFKQAVGKQNNRPEFQAAGETTADVQEESMRDSAPERDAAPEDNERWGLGQRAMSDDEYSVLVALNSVRTRPTSLIPAIEQKLQYLDESGNAFYVPGRDPETCVEGRSVYEDAIAFLRSVRPLVTLLDVPVGMLFAARDHVLDLKSRMDVSQDGTDGSTPQSRLERYGTVGRFAQLTSLAQCDPTDIVMQLVVNDGVSSRIDRKTIFDPDVRLCGVAIGSHSIHDTVAVVMLAQEFSDAPSADQRNTHERVTAALQQ